MPNMTKIWKSRCEFVGILLNNSLKDPQVSVMAWSWQNFSSCSKVSFWLIDFGLAVEAQSWLGCLGGFGKAAFDTKGSRYIFDGWRKSVHSPD